MRISDWSSDVCSSDLDMERGVDAESVDADFADPVAVAVAQRIAHDRVAGVQIAQAGELERALLRHVTEIGDVRRPVIAPRETGSESCREKVCQYVSIPGVAVSIKNKQHHKNKP